MSLKVFYNSSELKLALDQFRSQNSGQVGFVPTMGALHEGHASLLREAKNNSDLVVLSIFVNPTQFGPNEDLDSYPRTLESDLEVAKTCEVDFVYVPDKEDLYPPGDSTFIEETVNSQGLCGEFRPGHFRGVTTVVYKLFQIVKPDCAYFGLKDAQQFYVLSKMVLDLGLSIEMRGVATVREKDGLALSSRNRYLSQEDREKSIQLYAELCLAKEKINSGQPVKDVCEDAVRLLSSHGFQVQYFTLREFERPKARVIAAAAYLGSTRLIDNISL